MECKHLSKSTFYDKSHGSNPGGPNMMYGRSQTSTMSGGSYSTSSQRDKNVTIPTRRTHHHQEEQAGAQ